jgi:hypothetical protein
MGRRNVRVRRRVDRRIRTPMIIRPSHRREVAWSPSSSSSSLSSEFSSEFSFSNRSNYSEQSQQFRELQQALYQSHQSYHQNQQSAPVARPPRGTSEPLGRSGTYQDIPSLHLLREDHLIEKSFVRVVWSFISLIHLIVLLFQLVIEITIDWVVEIHMSNTHHRALSRKGSSLLSSQAINTPLPSSPSSESNSLENQPEDGVSAKMPEYQPQAYVLMGVMPNPRGPEAPYFNGEDVTDFLRN